MLRACISRSKHYRGCQFRNLLRSFCSSSGDVGAAVPYRTLESNDVKAPDSVPDYADAVIIGGGSLGTSTLYHLAKYGMKNVVLLEKDQLTSGTTWHSAGLVWRLRPSDIDNQLLNYTQHLAAGQLEEETGLFSGFLQNGGMFIANNKERMDEYKKLMTLGKVTGVEAQVLSPEDSKILYPLLNTSDMYGSLYSPGDGTLDPASWVTALARGATQHGAKIFENCRVTGLKTKINEFGRKQITGVETAAGTIATNCIVNCGGVWAPKIGEMAGVVVPLTAMHHAYIVTEKIEGIQNMPNIRDHDASVYLKLQGDGLSIGGYEPNPVFWEKVKDNFAFSLFDLDWDVFGVHVEGACNRVPEIENTGIKSTVCGPESFTADHKPLMGPDPDVRGYYHCCGFNSAGMMFGGGCGNEMAKWIIHGHPDLDMFGFDIRRFHTSLTNVNSWVVERSHESYAKNYSMVFANDEPLASRNMRTDPFHQVLLDAGCVYQERHGWERPGWFLTDGTAPILDYDFYGSYGHEKNTNYNYFNRLKDEYTFEFPQHFDTIGKECIACRNSVAVFNMSYFAKFFLTGPDAAEAVDWIFTGNLRKPIGTTTYTCMLNNKGGTAADLTVSIFDEGNCISGHTDAGSSDPIYYFAIGGAIGQHAWGHIHDVLESKKFDCKLVDRSEDIGMLSVQGPNSRALLEEISGADLSNEAFPFSSNTIITIAGHQVQALRLTFVGELGWELHIPKEACLPVYHAIMEAGQKYDVINSGYRAIDSLSIEKGYRHWHADIRDDDTPLEAGLAFTCKLKTDIPFLGREVLEKQKEDGLRKKLVCLTIDDHEALVGLEGIWRNDQPVGFVRRAGYGYHIGKSIAYGYIQDPNNKKITNKYLRSGEYKIESMGRYFDATLHLKSPFDPDNERIKGNYFQEIEEDTRSTASS